ncbi:uncharacterized protein si:ch211-67e16.11 [Chiloscyllium plagiosum]|uniref:uncharacterized protein si:ch211-67e16.11 n=1 Tax=Chiloscyllium plagiosum TaxID=36176 RepID=UPI001CB7F69B|nr:uncharacterized protein si:ch211-67e16.11 [Chiloscyllium plagiosum]
MSWHWEWLLSVAILVELMGAEGSQFKAARLHRWSTASLGYLKSSLCQRVSFLSDSECKRLAEIPQTAVAVYAAEPRAGEKLLTILPDSGLSLGSPHDAVITLDPSPELSFGHPVTVFYVDFNVNERRCGIREGLYLELKVRGNKSKHHRRKGGLGELDERLRLYPVVELKLFSNLRQTDRHYGVMVMLRGCTSHSYRRGIGCVYTARYPIPTVSQWVRSEQKGFAACPQPLSISSPNPAVANCELNKNTRRCHRQQLSSQKSCRMYQTCDHGVLLSGGWKEQLTYQRHVHNVLHFYRMLRRNGFRVENIKTFFAGDGQIPVDEETEDIYPATEKVMIRSHISYICRAVNCADSLVLYLNSPTRNDGTMLLWDVNKNGIADQKEKYTVGELLMDLEGCNAHRVLIFVDQSYPGTLAKKLLSSKKHPNVILISNSRGSEFTWASCFTEFWGELHPNQCLIDYLFKNVAWAAPSTLGVIESTPGLLNSTIYGGPCYDNPPLTPEEVRREYMGCQNLPTAVWYQTIQRKDLLN